MPKAIVTGVTGQDGAYLSRFLLEKGYKVYGTFRRISQPNFERLQRLGVLEDVELIPFDLLDQSSMIESMRKVGPDEIYNLAAQSFVGASFEQPVATGQITGLGVTRLLDSMRLVCPEAKFYQASSSEMFGKVQEVPQRESTPFYPRSPYAAAKLYGHWVTINYREAYDLFACCGILFNHESPLRGLEFVTRKITYSAARIYHGLQKKMTLGNTSARRDWGYAGDYVEGMWLMMQQDAPDSFVLATGENHSVEDFARMAFALLDLDWREYVETDESLYRPTEVQTLLGDPGKAAAQLGWDPKKTSFEQLVRMMVESDVELVAREKVASLGFDEHQVRLYPHFRE